jgi:hypothetical protein
MTLRVCMGGGVVLCLVSISRLVFFALQRELLQTHTPNEDNRDKWWPIGQQLKHGIRCLQFQTLSFSLRLSVSFIHATVHYLSLSELNPCKDFVCILHSHFKYSRNVIVTFAFCLFSITLSEGMEQMSRGETPCCAESSSGSSSLRASALGCTRLFGRW